MIDKSGEWWTGTEFADLAAYLEELIAETDPAPQTRQSLCRCSGSVFALEADQEEGCARRTCVSCSRAAFVADSADYWEDADPRGIRCPCGQTMFEVGVAFSLRDNGDVRWVTVGVRCVSCGVLGSCVDWQINYSPTDHLLTAV